MRIFGGEQQLCPCYEECQEFQKLAELKDSGLVIYCHRTRTEDIRQDEADESTSKDIFILHNKNNVKITTSELRSELEKKYISCPRCRKTLDHAQELMQEVKSIEKKIVMGICDHCCKKAKTIKKKFCTCDDIVNKFKSVKGEQKEDIKKYVKIWLSKMGNLLMVNKPKQMKYRAHSDLQINRHHSPRQEPKIQQMFYSDTHKSDINLNTQMKETDLKEDNLKTSVPFFHHTKPVAISFARTSYESEKNNTMIPRTSLLDSETTSMKAYTSVKELPRTSLKVEKQEKEIFVDTPSMDAKEELKRRHDLSLRQMMKLESDSGVLVSVSKRPHVHEIPKIAPWEQKEPTTKYHVESDMKNDLGSRSSQDLDLQSKILLKYGTSRTLQKNLRDPYYEQKKADKYYHSDNKKRLDKAVEKNIKKLEQRSVEKFSHKTKKLEPQVAKLKTWYKKVPEPKETGIKRQFSFFFPKVIKKEEKQVQIDVSSTHLIKYTQEKFFLQAEKKRQEDQQKLNQKKISREEKKVQALDKERQTAEDLKTYEEEQQRLTKHKKNSKKDLRSPPDGDKEKQDKAKRDKSIQDTFETDDASNKSEVAQKDRKSEHKFRSKIASDSDKAKKGTTSKFEQGDRFNEKLKITNKDLKSKPEPKHKIDEILEKTKKDVKGKPELKDKGDDEVIDSRKKDLNEKPKQKSKYDDLISKATKNHKGKLESKDKSTEKGSKDLKLEAEQKDQVGGSEKPKKQQQKQLSKEIDSSSKKGKSTQIKRDSLDEIKVSMSTILKTTVKEKKEISVNEKFIVDIKQENQIKTKNEEKEPDEKVQQEEEAERLKLIEELRKEKEARKKEAEKEQQSKDKETPSKTLKSIKIKQDSPDDIQVSLSEIRKKISKDKKGMTANEKEIVEIKKEITGKRQEMKEKKESKDKTSKDESELKKLQADQLKEKALQKKKQLEHEAEVAKEKARNAKEQGEHKEKSVDLKMGDIKIEDFTESELILRLVQIKQAASMKPSDIEPAVINEHKCHHGINIRLFCPLCYNSELELEVISLDNKMNEPTESLKDIIIGEKIYKIKRCLEKTKEPGAVLNFYQHFSFDPSKEITLQEEPVQNQMKSLSKKNIDMEPGKGVLRYALSDRTFIEKGWTVLPTEKVVRKMNVYRMRPAHPEFDWFEHNKNKRLMTYETGERLAEFDDNGRGRWYYRSGRLALDYYDAEETNAQQRFVIYSSGEPDERGRTHPITILATFDYLGNGIVFDHAGKIRLKYNQTEGVVLDRAIGPVSHWKWHTLNDPPVLQQVMIDTQLPHKDPEILKLGPPPDKKTRPDNEEMLAIEFDNFIKEKSKKLSQKFKPFQIKMKALKINEHFSLRVLDQATIYLIFRDGSTNLKLNIGMILDHKEIVDTETAEVGEVSNSLEQFPARTDSLAGLQRSVAHAQRYERRHAERERRLRRPEPSVSADQLTAATSPPMRLPLRTVPTGPSSTTGCCSRKPTNNLYYNTRLL